MKKLYFMGLILLSSTQARADLWGGDLPLLAQIVINTLQTLNQLQTQTGLLKDEMAGINDRIYRIQTIADVVQPSSWEQWKNPQEAVRRLQLIYETLPKEYRSEKSDMIADELSKAMNMIARMQPEARSAFASGKEMERRGADASPGVAQKLTASGVGTLISLESQSQVIQSHVVSLLSQMLADANDRESRGIVAKGKSFSAISENLNDSDGLFSKHILDIRAGASR